ncbi:MAG: fused MFS/spermidine synthase, partial [Anaerolineales bacterium]
VQAVYGREGDHFRFYEINPTVVEIAQSDFFSYLSDSPAEIEIILGDGRISLEQELISHGSNNFDLLVLDAFNSDSVPTHLLTKEAFSLYLQHLKPQGILALNISNRYLNLRPAIWILAEHFGLDGIEINNVLKDPRSFPASWILLTSSQTFLQNPNVLRAGTLPPRTLPDYKLWTDNYSNLFQLLY